MKDSIWRIKKMVMAYLLGHLATFIKEIIMKTFVVTLDRCIGVTEAGTKVNGSMESNMEKGLYLRQVKVLKKVSSKIIYLSRFTNSSQPLRLHLKCEPEPFIKICRTNWKPFKRDNIKEVLMVVER
jgi:hypothetical protein